MTVRLRALWLCSVSGLTLGIAGGAAAAPAAPAAPGAKPQIEEVVVTAQKRKETAIRTPISITAITGATLAQQGVTNVTQLQNLVPALNVSNGGFGINLNIRGVTTTDQTSKGTQGIAFNVDGVPLGRPQEMQAAFFDLDRVEVLRGPQGTLYGTSSTGGAINLITTPPSTAGFAAGGVFEYGNYDTRRFNGYVNIPVTDDFAIRVAGATNYHQGFFPEVNAPTDQAPATQSGNDRVDGQDDSAVRISALYKLTPEDTLRFAATIGVIGGPGFGPLPFGNAINNVQTTYYNPFKNQLNDGYQDYSGSGDFDLGYVHLSLLGARLNFEANDFSGSDTDPADDISQGQEFVAWREYRASFGTDYAELKLNNQNPSDFNWVAGVSAYDQHIHESDHNWNAPLEDPTFAASLNNIDPRNDTVHHSLGIYAQPSYNITDTLKLTLGARESWDSLQRIGTFAAGPGPYPGPNGLPCVAPEDCIGGPNNGKENATKFTYRAALDWQFTPTQMLYAYTATGYKTGGFNDFSPVTHHTAPYAPESLTAYEVGYKGRPFENLQITVDGFYYDYARAQISSLEFFANTAGPPTVVIYTQSVPETIYGGEASLQYEPTFDDRFTADIALEHGYYNKFEAGFMGNVNWNGYAIDKTPAWAGDVGWRHTFDLANGGTIETNIFSKFSARYQVNDIVDAEKFAQPSFTRTDLSVRYTTPNGKYYLEGFVNNVENGLQLTSDPAATAGSVSLASPNGSAANVTDPRLFGLRVGFKY